MQIYDLSMPISELMPVYKNREEKRPKLEVICKRRHWQGAFGRTQYSRKNTPLKNS